MSVLRFVETDIDCLGDHDCLIIVLSDTCCSAGVLWFGPLWLRVERNALPNQSQEAVDAAFADVILDVARSNRASRVQPLLRTSLHKGGTPSILPCSTLLWPCAD
jgi:hypothetical protein